MGYLPTAHIPLADGSVFTSLNIFVPASYASSSGFAPLNDNETRSDAAVCDGTYRSYGHPIGLGEKDSSTKELLPADAYLRQVETWGKQKIVQTMIFSTRKIPNTSLRYHWGLSSRTRLLSSAMKSIRTDRLVLVEQLS